MIGVGGPRCRSLCCSPDKVRSLPAPARPGSTIRPGRSSPRSRPSPTGRSPRCCSTHRPSTLATTDAAQLATLTLSLVAWEAARPGLAPRRRCLRRPLARARSRRSSRPARSSATEGIALAVARADACRRCDDDRPGRLAALLGRHARAGGAGLRRGAGGVLGRQRQRPWPGGDRWDARGPRRRHRRGPGARRAQGDAARRRRRVPHPVAGPGGRSTGAGRWPPPRSAPPTTPIVDNTEARPRTDGAGLARAARPPPRRAGAVA